jgi:hypothetical protein
MLKKVAGTKRPVTPGGQCASVRIFKLPIFFIQRINRRMPKIIPAAASSARERAACNNHRSTYASKMLAATLLMAQDHCK